ncbi:hypothetical protein CsSME_00021102 [Camellia sinensis var. sinensis]
MDWRYGNGEMSSIFLFEASGDSEGGFNHHDDLQNLFSMCHGVSKADADTDADMNADAESCSYDSSDILGFHDEIKNFSVQDQVFSDDIRHDDVDGRSGNGHVHYKCDCSCQIEGLSGVTLEIVPRKEGEDESRVGVHGNREEMVDEMERNKLFWETCLEVGLPMN